LAKENGVGVNGTKGSKRETVVDLGQRNSDKKILGIYSFISLSLIFCLIV
jgi:hypothetical protein